MDITDYLNIGHDKALNTRQLAKVTSLDERFVRELISKARRKTVILNLQDGKGYFLPSKEERPLVERWVKQEESRLKQHALALRSARKELHKLEGQEVINDGR